MKVKILVKLKTIIYHDLKKKKSLNGFPHTNTTTTWPSVDNVYAGKFPERQKHDDITLTAADIALGFDIHLWTLWTQTYW